MSNSSKTSKKILIDISGLNIEVNIPRDATIEVFRSAIDAVEKQAQEDGKCVSDFLDHTLISLSRELNNPDMLHGYFSILIAKHFCIRPKDLEKDDVTIDAMMLVGHCGASKEAIMN